MRVALGADHAGVTLKVKLKEFLDKRNVAYKDFGTTSEESVDYPDYALQVAQSVASGEDGLGILVCGSGIGMAIAANKVKGIRAAPVADTSGAQLARQHNNANVLALGSRNLSVDSALEIVDMFLSTPFEGGRHLRRLDKIDAIENS